ncbi:MAG: thermostable hemolysin delta-VPH [Clostridia bacterium]|nr:thermostable hemolysin delta-VPH [Clostridia bacterium]
MSYFNYHAKVKNLIKNNHCLGASILYKYNNIKPAMVFYFDNHIPMPIRSYMWDNYLQLIKKYNIPLNNPDNIPLD